MGEVIDILRKGAFSLLALGLVATVYYSVISPNLKKLNSVPVFNPSEILPGQVTLDSKIDTYTWSDELAFHGVDTSGRSDIYFVDSGYNGSLDYVLVQNSEGKHVVDRDNPYFSEWNEKFLEMRERRFGE
jgi:hypothetical protein